MNYFGIRAQFVSHFSKSHTYSNSEYDKLASLRNSIGENDGKSWI